MQFNKAPVDGKELLQRTSYIQSSFRVKIISKYNNTTKDTSMVDYNNYCNEQ